MPTRITFIGTAAVLPEEGQDSASFVIDGRVMVDCGWAAALGMRLYHEHPQNVEALLITHCHHDHVMGLPALLFYWGMTAGGGRARPPLRIYGPAGEIEEVVENTRRFLRADKFPPVWPEVQVLPLSPGDAIREDGFDLTVTRALHPVPALCYRYEDADGARLVFTGDTGYNPDLVEFSRGADLLIHEASLSPGHTDRGGYGHSSPDEAALIARAAGVKRLALIHYPRANSEAILNAARQVFPETILATQGLAMEIA
jgi:ribonuclease Z